MKDFRDLKVWGKAHQLALGNFNVREKTHRCTLVRESFLAPSYWPESFPALFTSTFDIHDSIFDISFSQPGASRPRTIAGKDSREEWVREGILAPATSLIQKLKTDR